MTAELTKLGPQKLSSRIVDMEAGGFLGLKAKSDVSTCILYKTKVRKQRRKTKL